MFGFSPNIVYLCIFIAILHLWSEVMHEVPSVHDGPACSLRLRKLHRPLPPTFSALFFSCLQTHATKEKAGYFMTREAPGEGFKGSQERCSVAGVIHRHLASSAGNLGGRVCVLEGCGPAGPSWVCTQSGTAAGWPSTSTLTTPAADSDTHRWTSCSISFSLTVSPVFCLWASLTMVIPAATVW